MSDCTCRFHVCNACTEKNTKRDNLIAELRDRIQQLESNLVEVTVAINTLNARTRP